MQQRQSSYSDLLSMLIGLQVVSLQARALLAANTAFSSTVPHTLSESDIHKPMLLSDHLMTKPIFGSSHAVYLSWQESCTSGHAACMLAFVCFTSLGLRSSA